MAEIRMSVDIERWPFAQPVRITGYTITDAPVVLVTLTDGIHTGRGEASGVYYHRETPQSMAVQLEALRGAVEAGITRDALIRAMPAGGARNALDAALWDLDAQRSGMPAWRLAGLAAPAPLRTTFTLGVDAPAALAATVARMPHARAIKLKLDGDVADLDRVLAVRRARPDVDLHVDANQGWSVAQLRRLLPPLAQAGVKLIEQPLPVGADAALREIDHTVPIAADEAFIDLADLPALRGKYDVVNIKLDKCGGLTRGLELARAARSAGFGVMVGCMGGSSLAMAPAALLGQCCDLVDLDAPTFLAADRAFAVQYDEGFLTCPSALWGGGSLATL
ncbi:L-Ala-D/L-Glu epimerase [Paraburkholderia unamae]|nr:L-Ala-D/L-Glu epimerase [Paraburkholderia unamae]